MCKKIGILGGTFDPFHKGHFMMAKSAYEQFGLNEVWIMPNGNPPHKRNQKKTDFKTRCELVQLAIKNAPYMKVCDVEGSSDTYHYTYETLGMFKKQYPEDEFFFIIGADSLKDFPGWRKPEEIAKLCTLLVACRDESGFTELSKEADEIEKMFGGTVFIMNSPKVDAASSEIRAMISEEKDVSNHLDEEVLEAIKEKNLYKTLK